MRIKFINEKEFIIEYEIKVEKYFYIVRRLKKYIKGKISDKNIILNDDENSKLVLRKVEINKNNIPGLLTLIGLVGLLAIQGKTADLNNINSKTVEQTKKIEELKKLEDNTVYKKLISIVKTKKKDIKKLNDKTINKINGILLNSEVENQPNLIINFGKNSNLDKKLKKEIENKIKEEIKKAINSDFELTYNLAKNKYNKKEFKKAFEEYVKKLKIFVYSDNNKKEQYLKKEELFTLSKNELTNGYATFYGDMPVIKVSEYGLGDKEFLKELKEKGLLDFYIKLLGSTIAHEIEHDIGYVFWKLEDLPLNKLVSLNELFAVKAQMNYFKHFNISKEEFRNNLKTIFGLVFKKFPNIYNKYKVSFKEKTKNLELIEISLNFLEKEIETGKYEEAKKYIKNKYNIDLYDIEDKKAMLVRKKIDELEKGLYGYRDEDTLKRDIKILKNIVNKIKNELTKNDKTLDFLVENTSEIRNISVIPFIEEYKGIWLNTDDNFLNLIISNYKISNKIIQLYNNNSDQNIYKTLLGFVKIFPKKFNYEEIKVLTKIITFIDKHDLNYLGQMRMFKYDETLKKYLEYINKNFNKICEKYLKNVKNEWYIYNTQELKHKQNYNLNL